MKLLFTAPQNVFFPGEAGGVLAEMRRRADGLRQSGLHVDIESNLTAIDLSTYSVCHLYTSSTETQSMAEYLLARLPLVISPILDRTESNFVLRAHTAFAQRLPAMYSNLSCCRAQCNRAALVCARSTEERLRVQNGLRVTAPCKVLRVPYERSMQHASPKVPVADSVAFIGDAGNPRKNVLNLVRAVAGTSMTLEISGRFTRGPTLDALTALAADCPNVKISGYISNAEKTELLSRAAVVALPSLVEGIGLSAMEGGLFGCTVVVSGTGGARDYFGDRAYYTTSPSPGHIRSILLHAIENPVSSVDTILQACDPARCSQELIEAYRAVISSRALD